jgi:RNA polymerase sigma-70 factor (ECF subfamily)
MSLYSISGYKAKEIAEIMGIEPSTVRSCISRGRSRLRTGLDLKSEGVI